MPAYRITDKGKYSQIVAYTGAKIESFWAVGKQVYIRFEGPDFVISSKDGVFLQIPISNIAEPQTQNDEDLIKALAFMVGEPEMESNIYNSDGALTDDRTLIGGAYDLLFGGIDEFEVSSRVNKLTASESNILTGRNVFDGARNEGPITYIDANYTADLNADFTLVAESDLTVSLPTANIGDVVQIVSNGNSVDVAGLGGVLIDNQQVYSLIGYSSVRLSYTGTNAYSILSSNLSTGPLVSSTPSAFGSTQDNADATIISTIDAWVNIAATITDTHLVLFDFIAPFEFKYLASYPLGFRINVTGDICNLGVAAIDVFSEVSVFVNGVKLQTNQKLIAKLTPSSISLQAFAILQPNDIVSVKIKNTTNTDSIKVENLHVSIML